MIFSMCHYWSKTLQERSESSVPEFEPGNNDKEYKMEAIQDNAVYTKKKDGHLSGVYYLVE